MANEFRSRAAFSTRVTKGKKPSTLRRSSSSPFSNLPRKKPSSRPVSKKSLVEDDDSTDSRLEDLGLAFLADDLSLRDVAQLLKHIRTRMFSAIPERGAGMNSTRIAEILNFRRGLPPVVSMAHVHALSNAPTRTEREIAELVAAGVVRKVVVPGRGLGGAAVGEGLVLSEEWERVVREEAGLAEELRGAFIRVPAMVVAAVVDGSPRC